MGAFAWRVPTESQTKENPKMVGSVRFASLRSRIVTAPPSAERPDKRACGTTPPVPAGLAARSCAWGSGEIREQPQNRPEQAPRNSSRARANDPDGCVDGSSRWRPSSACTPGSRHPARPAGHGAGCRGRGIIFLPRPLQGGGVPFLCAFCALSRIAAAFPECICLQLVIGCPA